MIHLIKKYFDRKLNKSNMYISYPRISDNICQYTVVIIHGEKIKEYRIRLSYSNYEFVRMIILSIILGEDISTIYYDSYNNYQLIEFLKHFRFVKLNGLHGRDIKKFEDLKNEIEEDNIIDIQINKNINKEP